MFAGKEVRIFLKGDAKESYLQLKKQTDKESKAILASFEKIKEILKDNPCFLLSTYYFGAYKTVLLRTSQAPTSSRSSNTSILFLNALSETSLLYWGWVILRE